MRKSLYACAAIVAACLSLSTAYASDNEAVEYEPTRRGSRTGVLKTAIMGLTMMSMPESVKADIYGSEFVGCYKGSFLGDPPYKDMGHLRNMYRVPCSADSTDGSLSSWKPIDMMASFGYFRYPYNHDAATIITGVKLGSRTYNVFYDVDFQKLRNAFTMTVYASNISCGYPIVYTGVTNDTYTKYDNQIFASSFMTALGEPK